MRAPITRAVWLVAVLVVGILVGSVVGTVIGQGHDLNRANRERAGLASDVSALRSQLLALGEKPKVGPPGDRGDTGDRGERGERGRPGRDGRDGVDGITPACVFLPGECVGPAGPAGPQGAAGVDGQDGTDGVAGAPGPAGPQGPPGSSCPDGYSLQPDTLRGNDVMVCTKDAA